MQRHPARLCRKSPVPPPGTEPGLSSCQSICNTHPSLKWPLRHRTQHTLAQNFSPGEGGFPKHALLQEHSAQLTMATETVQPKRPPRRSKATRAWADICQATRARSHCHLPAAAGSSTPPSQDHTTQGSSQPPWHHLPLLPLTRTSDLCSALGQPRHLQGYRRASTLIRRLVQPWGLHPACRADAGSQWSGCLDGMWVLRGSGNKA